MGTLILMGAAAIAVFVLSELGIININKGMGGSMNVKANWIKDLEKREQEIVLLRKEQIIREGEVHQRECQLSIQQNALKEGYEALEKARKLNKDRLDAMVADAEAIGVAKGRAEERARNEALQKELDGVKNESINLLKDLLSKSVAALQANIKIERS